MTAPTYPGYLPPTPPPTPPTPQFPAQPSYPAAPGQLPPQQYGQSQYAPQYPVAQGYPAPQMAPPAPPLAQGSIDDFFNQPSAGGGKSLTFKAVGTRYIGIVTRPLGPGDIQQQTDVNGRPQTFRDGRPKFVMKVPLQMQPSAEYPDGLGVWYVKGQARDELVRAMAEAGAPSGPPEAGAIVDVTYTGDRPAGQGYNPAKQVQVRYARPDGTIPASAPPAQPPAPQPPTPEPSTAPVAQQAQPPAYGPPPAASVAPAVAAPPPSAAPASTPAPPPDMSEEQKALLARLTGQQGS